MVKQLPDIKKPMKLKKYEGKSNAKGKAPAKKKGNYKEQVCKRFT